MGRLQATKTIGANSYICKFASGRAQQDTGLFQASLGGMRRRYAIVNAKNNPRYMMRLVPEGTNGIDAYAVAPVDIIRNIESEITVPLDFDGTEHTLNGHAVGHTAVLKFSGNCTVVMKTSGMHTTAVIVSTRVIQKGDYIEYAMPVYDGTLSANNLSVKKLNVGFQLISNQRFTPGERITSIDGDIYSDCDETALLDDRACVESAYKHNVTAENTHVVCPQYLIQAILNDNVTHAEKSVGLGIFATHDVSAANSTLSTDKWGMHLICTKAIEKGDIVYVDKPLYKWVPYASKVISSTEIAISYDDQKVVKYEIGSVVSFILNTEQVFGIIRPTFVDVITKHNFSKLNPIAYGSLTLHKNKPMEDVGSQWEFAEMCGLKHALITIGSGSSTLL